MKRTDPQVQRFIQHLRDQCRASKITIIFANYKSIKDWDGEFQEGLDGYFNPPTKKSRGFIVVAAKRPMPTVLHTLAHEFVHFQQWQEQVKYYDNSSYLQLESRTEARALNLVARYNLPINMGARHRSSLKYITKLWENS